MANSLYIAAMEPGSGKSVVALGIMEMLSRRIRRLGYFRPVVPSAKEPDNNIRLIKARYQLKPAYEKMFAYTHEDARNLAADYIKEQTRTIPLMEDLVADEPSLTDQVQLATLGPVLRKALL